MNPAVKLLCGALALLMFSTGSAAASPDDVVIADGGVEITRAEFDAILQTSPSKILGLAAHDVGDRFEFINGLLVMRKLAAQVEGLEPTDPGYWDLYFELIATRADFAFQRLKDEVELADPMPLAREYYKTKKDQYARIPEERASSHILLASRPGLDRSEVRAKAADLLAQLRDGADWEQMVAEHSDDRGSKARGGSLDRWVVFGDKNITPPYTEALFEIQEVGGYSEVTDTQFGVHIIRLDGIKPSGYREFEEVADAIVADVRAEQRSLANKAIRARFNVSDDAYIDGDAMEEMFAPYK